MSTEIQLQLPVDHHEKPINFLTTSEIEQLLKTAKSVKQSRNRLRNYLMLLMLYRHGLRETELCNLTLNHLSLNSAQIWIPRIKGSLSTQHPVEGDELRALRRYLGQREKTVSLPWLFLSERNSQLSRHTVIYQVKQAGIKAGLGHITPHMLRHSCGYYLANRGYDQRLIQDYLGHRDPKHTALYTRTASVRFGGLWS